MKGPKKKMHYKIVFMLGAAIVKENGKFVLAKSDAGGPLLSEWRLMAAKKILKEKIADKIVIVSWKEIIDGEEIWRCEVMKDILTNKYKINSRLVDAIRQSEGKTIGNAIAISQYLRKKRIRLCECAFLTNFYHIPRTIIEFNNIDLSLRPLAAESFFVSDEASIRKDYGQTEFTFFDRLIKEMRGMKDWEFGTHK